MSNSGLATTWMHANWFDSPCLLRQVLECLNMKHAVSTLESTVINIGILVLDDVITDYPDVVDNEIVTLLKAARESLDDSLEFTLAWEKFCKQIDGLDLREKIQMTIEKRKDNKTLQFLMGFVFLVKRLFPFIESKQSVHVIVICTSHLLKR